MVTALMETFGFSLVLASIVTLIFACISVLALVWVIRTAPPRAITMTTGPEGSSFQRFADEYQKELAKYGVTLKIVPSGGSLENLQRLQAGDSGVDVGFVQGGVTNGAEMGNLMSLGSVSYQPLWVFYRSATPIKRLAELAGKRIAVGARGSGTHAIATTLLQANGISGEPTKLMDVDAGAAATGLQEGKLDAVFLMGDSAPLQTLRTLVRSEEIKLYSFTQADAYVRRYAYLSRMQLPQGSIDFGRNLPAEDVALIGPTVELVARKGLNSAISDLLLDAARVVHGKPGLLQKRGEFPAPLEHDIKLSEDALQFYKSGKGFLYTAVPQLWLASLIKRVLVAIVPIALLLIPAIRFLPLIYRWNIQLRIYRCYRPLLVLERDAAGPLTPEREQELVQRLDAIEDAVNHLKVPASFADQFYGLRLHINFVRQRLKVATPA